MNGSPQSARARGEARWQIWAQHKGWPARLLWPVSQLFAALNAARRFGYLRGWLHTERLRVPVIVVGNVVAGGAGKTPTVIALVQHLQRQGWRPGVVSRGYGRASDALVLVDNATRPAEAGDEPLLIHQTTGAPVCVARQRAAAGRALLARHPAVDLIVCDDGLQHLALGRDLSIAVFDERGIGNGWLLPAGLLREPWPPSTGSPHRHGLLLLQRRKEAPEIELATVGIPTFGAERRLADEMYNLAGERAALTTLRDQPLTALAGIARPSAFFGMLRERGLTLALEAPLHDHADATSYRDLLSRLNGLVICTEKDAVKLSALLIRDAPALRKRIWVAPLELRPEPDFFAAVDAALVALRLTQAPIA
jgi:tetraacyldisaccharide 4'-kinase